MDFTKYIENNKLLKVYGGANGGKRGFRMNGKSYMLKMPSYNRFDSQYSYSNSSISEAMGCEVLKSLEIDSQNTILGELESKKGKKICVACEDFEINGFRLYPFSSIKNDDIDTASKGNNTDLHEVLEAIEKQRFLPTHEVYDYFWKLFIADAFIGNPDRHNGNWGFLINEEKNIVKLSPVYDCGSSLSASASETKMKEILSSQNEINNRIYVGNRSAIKINNKRIVYYSYLNTTMDENCLKALQVIVPKIDMMKIDRIVEGIPYLSDIAITFHKTMLRERYEKMLIPALERANLLISNHLKLKDN